MLVLRLELPTTQHLVDLLPILLNATGVTITTMKLKIQFPVVEMALAGARISKGVISAG